jgi:hypothetical protein
MIDLSADHAYTHTSNACSGSSVQDIPSLLREAVVEAAMTDYPTASGFLTPLPAYPVRSMCRAIDNRQQAAAASSGNDGNRSTTAQLLLLSQQVRDAMNVYYNHTGAAACFGAEEVDDPYGIYDGWNWQACTEVMVMAYGVRDGSVLPPSPFNFTDVVDDCRKNTGLPPRPFWIETEFGGYVSGGAADSFLLGWAVCWAGLKLPLAGNGGSMMIGLVSGLLGFIFFLSHFYKNRFSLFQDIANVLKKSASNILFFNGLRDPWSTGG